MECKGKSFLSEQWYEQSITFSTEPNFFTPPSLEFSNKFNNNWNRSIKTIHLSLRIQIILMMKLDSVSQPTKKMILFLNLWNSNIFSFKYSIWNFRFGSKLITKYFCKMWIETLTSHFILFALTAFGCLTTHH